MYLYVCIYMSSRSLGNNVYLDLCLPGILIHPSQRSIRSVSKFFFFLKKRCYHVTKKKDSTKGQKMYPTSSHMVIYGRHKNVCVQRFSFP